jgi:quinol monooxygenase YgiN
MLTVVARYRVTHGHESTVTRLLRANAQASRAEPECLEFSVYQEIDDPRVFMLYERYTSEDAFQGSPADSAFPRHHREAGRTAPGRARLDAGEAAVRVITCAASPQFRARALR